MGRDGCTRPCEPKWTESSSLDGVHVGRRRFGEGRTVSNNARFFTWFESARIALFQRIGVATTAPAEIGPILATTTCDFVRPVVFPATLRVGVRVARVGETSITMEHQVTDASHLYARGSSVAVLVDYRSLQKVRVPDDVALRSLLSDHGLLDRIGLVYLAPWLGSSG